MLWFEIELNIPKLYFVIYRYCMFDSILVNINDLSIAWITLSLMLDFFRFLYFENPYLHIIVSVVRTSYVTANKTSSASLPWWLTGINAEKLNRLWGEDEFNFFLQELIVLAQLASCSIVLHFIFHIWFLFIEYFKDSDPLGIYAIAPLFIELKGIVVDSSPS